jgi:hypothetical protein
MTGSHLKQVPRGNRESEVLFSSWRRVIDSIFRSSSFVIAREEPVVAGFSELDANVANEYGAPVVVALAGLFL